MAEKRLSIRLAALDGKKVEQTFRDVGESGERAFQRISQSTKPASADLKAVDATARALNSVLRQAAGFIAAYAGIQGMVGAVRSIAETGMAFQGLDNALAAVTGSTQAAAAEMAFLEQEADRLGLNLLEMSQSYLQVTAAAKDTKLQGQATREIFTAIAEAATVLQLTTDQTSGSLRAIGQIMSKGKVQAEELRGQLGDRLYGAFQLAARGMGIGTAELDKMLQQGQLVAEEFLPRFAAEIRRTFSDGVPAASRSARAELNRFNNAVLELERTAAASGFMDGLTQGLRTLTEVLQQPEMREAAADLGKALGAAISSAAEALALLVRHADLAVTALGGLVAARVAAASFGALNAALATSGTLASLRLAAELSSGLAVRLAVLQGATQLATVAMVGFRTALAFIGGPVGLAVLAGVALVKLASGHDVAAKAASDHSAELAEIKQQAGEASEGLDKLADATANERFFRYEEQLRTARENIADLKRELEVGPIGGFWDQLSRTGTDLQDQLVLLRRELLNGRISADEYSDAMFKLARKYPEFGENAQQIREMVLALKAAELAATRADAALTELATPKAPATAVSPTAPAKPASPTLGDEERKRIEEQIAQLTAEERALKRVAAARREGEDAVRRAQIANEQEQALRRLGLATGQQEDAQRTALAGKVRGLVASIHTLNASEKGLQEQQRKNTELERERERTVEDVRRRFDALDKTLAGATRRAEEWRQQALQGLNETAAGYEAFRAEVEAVFNDMLREAREEDLRSSRRWEDGVTRGLATVADEAANAAAQTERLFTNAFKGMEDALVDFVKTGKLDFKSLTDSIITDLIRMQVQSRITGPLAGALNTFIGSMFGSPAAGGTTAAVTTAVAHTGGVIGRDALASRSIHPAVFAGAPRFHTGGVVGAEVPIIAKRGETVFTPGQMAVLGGALQSQPQVNVSVNIQNNVGNAEARTEVSRDAGGNLNLNVIIDEVENRLARNVSRGNGLAPTLERRYGLNPAAGSYR